MSNLFKTTGFFEGERVMKTIFDYVVTFDEISTIQWYDSENEFQLFQMQPNDLSLLVGAFEENFKYLEDTCFKDPILIELFGELLVKITADGWVEFTYEGDTNEDTGLRNIEIAKSTIEEIKSLYGAYKQMKKEQVEFEIMKGKVEKDIQEGIKTSIQQTVDRMKVVHQPYPAEPIVVPKRFEQGDNPAFKPFTF